MTPLREGRLHRLDESTEAIYLFGVADRADADRTPGWYLRRRMAGEAATIEAGPFASLDEASRAHLGPPAWTHGTRQTPEEILAEATLLVQRYRVHPGYLTGGQAMSRREGTSGRVSMWPALVCVLHEDGLVVGENVRVDDFVKLECGGGVVLGTDVHVASFVHFIGNGLTLCEAGSSFGSGAKVVSGSNTYGADHGCSAIAPDATVTRSFAWVKKNATLYAGAMMLPGCVLGEGSVLAAGAVLKANTIVGPHELWAGNPAMFKKRIG